ncbi:hypothetical protein [Nocardia sp. alder85J]|uniref:hypothetical protein n=1 Tax=Nocardia sp. alder85J TaxID=2862949 RepID=UPI001CD56E89|nr:hypothetical protein [Nocardia sp. alder85J]MCX4091357.1 hypothetical protein [Nocardia sp. alder85J]
MIVYPTFGSVEGTREFHESLSEGYNDARRQPGFDPYRGAAELQKRFISAHAWRGDFHGRHSRILMNFALEQAGESPSAVTEFDNDLLASSAQWTDEVRAGSQRYGRWQRTLARSGADTDPLDLFELRPMAARYEEMGGRPAPFAPGYHDSEEYAQLHARLRAQP